LFGLHLIVPRSCMCEMGCGMPEFLERRSVVNRDATGGSIRKSEQ
jgi:hypothetical protein